MKRRTGRSPRQVVGVVIAAVGFALVPAHGRAGERTDPAPAVDLKVVRYGDLVRAIRLQYGKVVVVDVWGTFCIPCMKKFPHVVELQRRYGKEGLVVISVSLDSEEDRDKALKFLTKQDAAFPNFLLDEKITFWSRRWKFNAPPAVFVFDRRGYRAARFDNSDPDKPFTHEDVEKLVKELLAEKP